jgi:alpha-glucosidase (family GH31 glycosyl hydrolase)
MPPLLLLLLLLQVWPGQAVYPDYLHPNISNWLTPQLAAFNAQVPFDGLW